MKKVMIVFGTRPEAIKMAPLCHQFKKEKMLETIVCVTAQHREMLDQVLSIFELTPDIDLDLMHKSNDLFEVTSNILLGMRDVLVQHKPDIVLIHGDTATALATTVACFYAGVSIGHVEAGLRTHDIYAPHPEEFNRRVTSLATKIHFAPTVLCRDNLIAENVEESNIFITGNTVIDSLYWVLNKIKSSPSESIRINNLLKECLPFDWLNTDYILITGHRRENFGKGILKICEAILALAKEHPDMHFIYPVHLNPNVQGPVNKFLFGLKNVHLIPPLQYELFVSLLNSCYLVLTDSGGIQEEAPSLGKPVLVMRDVTERPEAIKAGTVKLVGTDLSVIISHVNQLLIDKNYYQIMSQAHNPYGDGEACRRIVENIKGYLNAS